jgi:hypothetical protein
MRRDLLVLQDRSSTLDVCTPLAERGWRIERATDPDVLLHGASSAARCAVGLAVLDPADAWPPAALERLLALRGMEWVAAVPRHCLERVDWQRLLAHGFADYHTLPLDAERLAIILGHLGGRAHLRRLVDAGAAIVPADGLPIRPSDRGLVAPRAPADGGSPSGGGALSRAREASEREAILAALRNSRHNIAAAARELGVSRVTLYRMLDRHAIVRGAHDARLNGHGGAAD